MEDIILEKNYYFSSFENLKLILLKTDDKKVREKLAEKNPMIAKANTVMNTFYSNEKERAAYQAAWRYESDRVSMIKETEEKAMAKGIEKGMEEGERKAKTTMAKMMKQNKYDILEIIKLIGLSHDEIEKL
ncbi:MAG: PD-(D/E)XK nuclease family transposase [Treponema sp.]